MAGELEGPGPTLVQAAILTVYVTLAVKFVSNREGDEVLTEMLFRPFPSTITFKKKSDFYKGNSEEPIQFFAAKLTR